MTYCGSDIRLIEIEATRKPYAALLRIGLDHPEVRSAKKAADASAVSVARRGDRAKKSLCSACAVFPKAEIEKDIWLHNTMDVRAYAPPAFETKDMPQLVHAPSEPGIKGTEYVKVAIEELRRWGMRVFHFISLRMPAYRSATDIVGRGGHCS